jgi:hypothetical protein
VPVGVAPHRQASRRDEDTVKVAGQSISLIDIAVVNLAVFLLTVGWCGGDPVQGKVVGTHFFLGYHHHYTEVTPVAFPLITAYMIATIGFIIAAASRHFR